MNRGLLLLVSLFFVFLLGIPSLAQEPAPTELPLLTLQEAIRIAQSNNPNLKNALLASSIANEQIAEARTARFPTVKIYALGSQLLTPVDFTFGRGIFGTFPGIGPVPAPHPRFTARIEGPPEVIFDLIADMPNYGRWLPGSEAFGETAQVSPYPVRLGTTFLDAGPAGQRPGSVTGYDSPKYIAFHHVMLLKKGPLTANIDVHIRYTFEPVELATCVIRNLDLAIQIHGLLKAAEPLVVWAFRKENVRILAELKRYVEAQPHQRDLKTIGASEAP